MRHISLLRIRKRLQHILSLHPPLKKIYLRLLSIILHVESMRKKQPFLTWFLGDQSPPKDYPLWINFMNRETPFYSGPEKIARKFGHAVVFMNINKVKRGYYEVEFIPLFDDPKNTDENEITTAHVKMLEGFIRKEPAYWLWSHRRWKHEKPVGV